MNSREEWLSFLLILVGPILVVAAANIYFDSPWATVLSLVVGIMLVLIDVIYVSSDRGVFMSLFSRIRRSTSAGLLDLVDAAENQIQDLAARVIDLVDGDEVPARQTTISALSSSISNEQSEIESALARKARALEVLNRNVTSRVSQQ